MKKSNQEKKFPKNIKNLRFSKYLLKESANSKFHFALYKDKNGVNYYCKMWVGDKKDENYNWIINEIKAYKLLNSLKNKNLNKTNNKYSDIIIPKIFDENTSEKCVWFVIKEAKGKPLKFQNTEIVLNSYLKIHSLLSYFYARIDKKAVLPRKSIFFYFVLYHFYSLKWILKHPSSITILATSILHFYNGIFQMLLDPKSSLVLRDLASDANIFYSKGKLTIIDLESLVLTHPILNDACMLVVESNNEEFLDIYFKSTQFKSIKRNKKKLFMLKAMIIYGAVVDAAINKIDANLESKKLMQRIKNI